MNNVYFLHSNQLRHTICALTYMYPYISGLDDRPRDSIKMLTVVWFAYFQVLTKDSVTVAVDAVVYYRISDPIQSVCNVNDAFRSAQLLAATTLRNVLGTKLMAEILAEREGIANMMQVREGGMKGYGGWGRAVCHMNDALRSAQLLATTR